MSRLPSLVYEKLNADQKKAYDLVAGPRNGIVNGPFPAWIRKPDLCISIQKVSDILRTNTNLKKYMFETITLVVARHFDARYMWGAHSGFAIAAGLPKNIVDDINNSRRPAFDDEKDQLIFDISDCLASGQLLPQDLYDKSVELLGIDLLIEISTDVGFYIMIAIVLNTFNICQTPSTLPLLIE